jgi:signal transduction histidine kinase
MVRSVLLCDTPGAISALHAVTRRQSDPVIDVSTDALRALEVAARTRPDLVVCRLSMDGFAETELLTRFQAASPRSSIVVRLGVDDLVRASKSLRGGASGIVANDDDADTVLAVMRAVTGSLGDESSAGDPAVVFSPRVALELGVTLGDRLIEADVLRHELGSLRDRVSQGTSAKADFLSNISHELRTPVTVAKGIAYVLRNAGIGDDERAEFLDTLQESLDKLMGIIDRIIAMSELEGGTFALQLADIDVSKLAHAAVTAAREHHPSINIETSIAQPLLAVADPERLGHVIDELLDNACRYSPVDATVEISARAMSEGIVVSVTDHGDGLDRTVASRSFDEPFSTGEGVLRKEKAGVGVGLHLARQLVIEHGGTLWTDPLPGGGTRAAFCIPVPSRSMPALHADSA